VTKFIELHAVRHRASGILAWLATAAFAVSVGAFAAVAQTASTKTVLRILTPDTGLIWARDNGGGGQEAANNIQATLLRKPYVKDASGGFGRQDVTKFEGYLAEGYTVSDDGLTYTFKLRDAISNAGNHLTADDVIWSFQRKFNSPRSSSPGIIKPQITSIDQFTKIDDHTVSIKVAQPGYGLTLLALLSDLTSQIYDSKLLKQHATPDDPYAVAWSSKNPNFGFGPYKMESYTPGVEAVLVANDKFVLGKPPIERVVMTIVPDAGTRANALRNGDADIVENLTPADLVDLKGQGLQTFSIDNPNATVMIPLVTNKPPFDDVKVRQAFAWAMPYKDIIDNVYRGRAVRNGSGFLPVDAPGYDGSGLTNFSYDPKKAKELLASAGHADGVKVTLTVSNADPDLRDAAVLIQSKAKEAGFTVDLKNLPGPAFQTGRGEGTFQAFIQKDWAVTLTPSYELGVYTAKNGGNNLAKWTDDGFYAALDKANAVPDQFSAKAGPLWNAAERYLVNDAPIVFIAKFQPTLALAADVSGYAWRSDNWLDFSKLSFSPKKP
jgi:peptide/nickel transport system substrate-binding protein